MLAAQVVCHPHLHLHACLVHGLDVLVFALTWLRCMFLWVTRLLARFGRWLIRKIRQVQHNMSLCAVLSWTGIQTKSWTCNFVSFWIQGGHITCLKHINHAGCCLRVGDHEILIATAEFRRNTIIPCMLLEFFECRSRSNRPCAAKVQNNVCWMVVKTQWSGAAISFFIGVSEAYKPD